MTIRTVLLSIILLVGGCVTLPPSSKLVLPTPGQATYSAPDGRVWARYDSVEKPDSSYLVSFTPEPTALGKFKEMLSFTIKPGRSLAAETAETEKGLDRAKEVYPKMECKTTKTPDSFSFVCTIPDLNDRTVMKVVAGTGGVVSVSYECRSTADADNHVAFWSDYLNRLTWQSLGGSALPRGQTE